MIRNLSSISSAFILSILLTIGVFSGCEFQDGGDIGTTNSTGDLSPEKNISAGQNLVGNYPIVLVHGFIGWGRDELGGSKGHYYWGGYDDLQEILKKSGHECYTGVVGPFSSNWDRACELYAQLKGTRTDYGLAHSLENNHARFAEEGKRGDFRGKSLLKNPEGEPDWGMPGNHEKIDIIAHSHGALTVRMLSQLLETGFQKEIDASAGYQSSGAPISPLFTGSAETKNLIHSITTMAGVQNGTTLANSINKFIPMVVDLLGNIVAAVGIDENDTIVNIYDIKLQQFGFTSRQPGESIKDYIARMKIVLNNFLGGNRKDTCLWDLSPEGAREQNAWVHSQKNIYYFSFAGGSTHKALLPDAFDNWEKHQLPDLNNFLLWMVTAPMMGAYTCNDTRYHGLWRAKDYEFFNMPVRDRPKIDSSWWENDGVVNTKSMNGPWLYPAAYTGIRDQIVNLNRNIMPQKGIWNYGGKFSTVDHFDIIGLEIFSYDRDNYNSPEFTKHAEDWYLNWADYLRTIE